MSYKDFYNDFRKEMIGSSIFLYGAEDYLTDWAVDMIVERYVDEAYRSIDVVNIDGENASADEIAGASRAYSMFSDRKVIIVRNWIPLCRKSTVGGSYEGDMIIDICKTKVENSILVFTLDHKHSPDITAFGRKVRDVCGAYEMARLEPAELKNFITKRVREAGMLIGHRELEHLISLTGYYYKDSSYSLQDLNNDLYKITSACDGDRIDTELIEDLLTGEEDRFVFNLVDALTGGDRGRAMQLAVNISSDDDEVFKVIGLLIKQFEIMYDAEEMSAEGMNVSQMSKKIGVNEYRFRKAYQAASRFGRARIRELLIRLYNIDRDVKAGTIDKTAAFEVFVMTV